MKNAPGKSLSLAAQFKMHYLIISLTPLALVLTILFMTATVNRGNFFNLLSEASMELSNDAKDSLQRQAEEMIVIKSADVARQIEIYFMFHPDITLEEMREDPYFIKTAIQNVGKTGYTAITESETVEFKVHPNPELIDIDMRVLQKDLQNWSSVVNNTRKGKPFTAYYRWIDPDGSFRSKFLASTPVQLGKETYMVSATTYIDEFLIPVEQMRNKADVIMEKYKRYVSTQWMIFSFIATMITALAFISIYFVTKRSGLAYISPIIFLANVVRDFGRDNFEMNIPENILERQDEVGTLGTAFKQMSDQIKSELRLREKQIRELRRTKEALKTSEKRYSMISEFSSDYIYLLDFINGSPKLQWVSGAYEEITGYTPEVINTMTEGWLSVVLEEDRSQLPDHRTFDYRFTDMKKSEYRIKRKDGSIIWISDRMKPVFRDGRVVSIMGAARDVTVRKSFEEKIKTSLAEKELLIKELYHRTKNNMQTILAIINFQESRTESVPVKQDLKELQNIIHAMSLVHEKLYESEDLFSLNLKDYLTDLFFDVFHSYEIPGRKVEFELEIEDITVSIDTAIPCGLITNELLTNIYKHAFRDRSAIRVLFTLRETEDDFLELRIEDNGPGFSDNYSPFSEATYGLPIVKTIIQDQLNGSVSYKSGNGVKWTIKFRGNDSAARLRHTITAGQVETEPLISELLM